MMNKNQCQQTTHTRADNQSEREKYNYFPSKYTYHLSFLPPTFHALGHISHGQQDTRIKKKKKKEKKSVKRNDDGREVSSTEQLDVFLWFVFIIRVMPVPPVQSPTAAALNTGAGFSTRPAPMEVRMMPTTTPNKIRTTSFTLPVGPSLDTTAVPMPSQV
ncbi:hypothetical protein AG1IA_07797 [Rhizoctonia solani AG-1 IA]|uniref:Uncharacterized protein n=1 Tax=Thanatephorus cucumeris (strain AG1-IA) TaxID=983506 RepID=L8WN23_THACA|nr:hypothetical protein AG1IA_07797 [Rhizoctonia solani AG-1 IA]